METTARLRTRKPFITALVTGISLATPFLAHTQGLTPRLESSLPPLAPATLSSEMKSAIAHSSMAFEANQGQTDKRVQFLARGAGYALFLTPTRVVFDFQESKVSKKLTPQAVSARKPIQHQVLAMQLLGAARHPAMEGVGRLPGTANYFIGSDPKQWHSKIATFDKVRYRSVYPGVDLLYYGSQQRLEYDFVVAPHHDPGQISFKMEGAKRLTVDNRGDLVIGLPKGEIRWHKPVLYQEVQGKRTEVAGHYRLQGDRIAFAVASYDTNRPLVIDPQLSYSTYLGGSSADYGNGIATYLDSTTGKTYVYVTGETTSSNFPTTAGAHSTTRDGGSDGFLTKLDMSQSGNASVVFSTYIGGNGSDMGNAVAVDSSGCAYIGGNSASTDFPAGTSPSLTHGFAAKFSSSGALDYLLDTKGAATDAHTVTGIAVDGADTVWVIGSVVYNATYFLYPYSMNGYQPTSASGANSTDAYVKRFSTTTSAPPTLDYATLITSSGGDSGTGISVGPSHRAYATGYGSGTITGFSSSVITPIQASYSANVDGFVVVLNPGVHGATTFQYASYLGSSDFENAYGIATVTESGGDVDTYVVGVTDSHSGFPTHNAYQSTFGGTTGTAAFLCAFKNLASSPSVVYSTLLGGGGASGGDYASAVGVAADGAGKAYVTGDGGVRFPLTKDAFQPYGAVFVSKIDTTLTGSASLLYSTYLGGSADNQAASIAIDGSSYAYITGRTDSYSDMTTSPLSLPLPTTSTAFQTTFQSTGGPAGPYNAFVTKLSTTPETHATPFDFDGDGLNDLVFQYQDTFNNYVVAWYMQAYRYLGGAATSINPAVGYQIVGVADFNNDGHPDLMYQNTSTGALVIWYMGNTGTHTAGTDVLGSASVSSTPAAGYTVAGVSTYKDIFNNTHPEIIFQNLSGTVVIWYMTGSGGNTYSSGATLASTLPSGYKVAGVGDFGGASGTDIVLQNTSTGGIKFWMMNNATISSTVTLTGAATNLTILPSGYTIVAIADYNSDGYTDLVLQNSAGAILFFLLQGTYTVGGGTSDTTPASGYFIVGPH